MFRDLMNLSLLAAIIIGWPLSASAEKIDPMLADYEKVSGVSGSIISVGSDTLANLMTLWAEEFKRF